MSVSFDYYCATCDSPFCERVNLLNLALNYEDEGYCLACLAQDQEVDTELELINRLRPYILSRDCFKKPWLAQSVKDCQRLPTGKCFCQD